MTDVMAIDAPAERAFGEPKHTITWFDDTVSIPPQARELLRKYSHIPSQELEETVISLVRSDHFPFLEAGTWER
jgi:hypothetical protein